MSNVIEVLQERGFIEALTNDEIKELTKKPIKVYCGFDPTGDSLHLGNMVAIMGLAWFQKFGHTPFPVIGGGTGMIGDPSGKSKERNLLDEESLKKNIVGIRKNLEAILDFSDTQAKPVLLNNFDWLKNFTMIDFLRDVGKFFRLGPMLAKESVRQRMNSEEGLSYTEFSYQLLQGYDFLYLLEHYGVEIQLGGSDQWGNITAGIDLIRKVRSKQTFGVTFPLLMTSDGKKFGKTEEGAIWLSPDKLSPYQFYQYLIRVADADVIKLMRMLTFMEMEEIREIERQMSLPGYSPNSAQKRLAEEVTLLVHGREGLLAAQRVTNAAKPGSETALNAEMLESVASEMPSRTLQSGEVLNSKLVDLIVVTNLQDSKGQARKLIKNGGVYLNNQKVTDENKVISKEDLIEGRLLLLAVGKKNKTLIRLLDKND
jgi:tyrosyl-tRNA synthetase